MKPEQTEIEETEPQVQCPLHQASEKRIRMARILREIADELRRYYDLTTAPRQLDDVAGWIEGGEV